MAKDKGFGLVGWLVIVALLAVLGAAGFWYWKESGEKTVEYKTMPITTGDLIQLVTATGQLNPVTNVQVGSQVSGIIRIINADFNSKVTNGQVIAQLDPATYKAQVAQAQGELQNAKAALELAKVEEERSKVLFDSKIVAQSDHDTTIAGLHQAEAQIMIKQAALEQSQVNLAYTTIYAPVDGIIISRNVDVGQTVAASLSSPTLFMIANDLTKMQIDALVSEADVGGVETNQTVNFSVDAFPQRQFHGTVVQIRNAPQTNQNVITYDAVISVHNGDLKLRPGMTANVSIVTAQTNNSLKIPNAALRFHPPEATNITTAQGSNGMRGESGASQGRAGGGQGQGGGGTHAGGGSGKPRIDRNNRTVYLLATDANGKQTAKPVQIKTGINDGVSTQVIDGLKEGDEVIVGMTTAAGAADSQSSSSPFGGMRRF